MTLPEVSHSSHMESYSLRNMYLSVFIVNLLYFSIGVALVWTSPMMPYLVPSLHLTTWEQAAITSSLTCGGVLGPGIGGIIADWFGYKSVLFLNAALNFTSLFFLNFPSVICICVGRLISGVAVGAVLAQMPLYVVEIADPEVLTIMNPTTLPIQSLGYLVVYVLGPHLTYSQLLYLQVPVPILTMVCLFWMPESPYYYVRTGSIDRAKQAIALLRRGISTYATQVAIQDIQNSVNKRDSEHSSWVSLLSAKAHVRSVCLSAGLASLQQLAGGFLVLSLAQTLLKGSSTAAVSSTATVGVGVFLAAAIIPPLTRNCGYKSPLVVALLAMALSMLVFGLYLLNLESGNEVSGLSWVPLVCVILYLVAFQIGCIDNTDAVVSQLYNSPQMTVLGTSLTLTASFFTAFLVCCIYYPLSLLTTAAVVWAFAFFSSLAAILVCLCVPDTSNMSPAEIQDFLNHRPWLSTSWFKGLIK